ncbi:hypothetical protein ABPG75_010642 [Micractinium tetrahymenae]
MAGPGGGAKAAGGPNFKLLLAMAVLYGTLYKTTTHFFAQVPEPLPADADPRHFAEGRVMQHLDALVNRIGHRHVGSPGEELSAQYILSEVDRLAAQVAAERPDLVAEAAQASKWNDHLQVSGGVTMHAFKFEIANVYANLSNVVLRLSPADPEAASRKAVLLNSHYDSTLGTKGASDCGSCVAILLEVARTVVANHDIQLAAPIVFLFNGGEETLSQAANGFFTHSKYARQLGAFINLESTGPWGPDVVFQHTGDWTLQAYARSAPHPRGTTMAQDFFDLGLIPADTDYRMFSYRHYGSLPGIDVAFIFDGTAYHTARDDIDRIRPGTLQDMGENVLAAALEFARVLATDPEAPKAGNNCGSVYFDLWGRAMVIYSHAQAKALHHAPLFILLLLPLLASASADPWQQLGWGSLLGSTLLALCSVLCALGLPAALGAARAVASGIPMAWYGRPVVAYTIYLPAAAAGLLLPHLLVPARPGGATPLGRSLGTALLFALICSGLTAVGMHSSFFYALWAAAAAASAALLGTGASAGAGWGGAMALAAIYAAPVAVALPSAVTFMAHVMEKVGLAGAAPGTLGLLLSDTAVGAVAGATLIVTFGTLTPLLAAALGRRRGAALAAAALALSVGAAAWASREHALPYSREHPKRLLVQHIHRQGADGAVVESKLGVVGLDAFPLEPALPPSFASLPPAEFAIEEWESFYPLNYLISGGAARAAPGPDDDAELPVLRLLSRGASPAGPGPQGQQLERLELELDTGKPGAWGVMNMTGEVLRWSLTDRVASTDIEGGGVSHMVRFAANMYARTHRFWLDVPAGQQLSVRVLVKHVEDSPAAAALLADMPDWTSPAVVVSYQSRWQL